MVISIDRDVNDIRNRRWDDLQKHYSAFKEEIVKLDTHNNMVSSVNEFRKNRLENNEHNLLGLERDLNTVRRQIEINQNSSKRKADFIRLLRATLFYFCIMFLLIFTMRGHAFFPHISGLASILMTLYIIKTLWDFYNRDPNRWQVIRWEKGKVAYGEDEEEDSCLFDDSMGLNISDESEKNMLLGEILKTRNLDSRAETGEQNLDRRAQKLNLRKKHLEDMIANLRKIEQSKQKKL